MEDSKTVMPDDFGQKLDRLSKKVDKMLALETKIAKALHLLPVTEREERDMQATMRGNASQALAVSADMDAKQGKPDPEAPSDPFSGYKTAEALFGDVLADDLMPEEV